MFPIPEKAKLYGEYVRGFNLWFDIWAIIKTALITFTGKDEVEGKK